MKNCSYNKAANCSRQTQEQVLKELLGELGSAPLECFQSQPWRRKNGAAMQRFVKGEEGDGARQRETLGTLAATVLSSLINPRTRASCSSSQLSSSLGSIPTHKPLLQEQSNTVGTPPPRGRGYPAYKPLLSSATATPAAPTDPQKTAEEVLLGSDIDHLQGGNRGQLPQCAHTGKASTLQMHKGPPQEQAQGSPPSPPRTPPLLPSPCCWSSGCVPPTGTHGCAHAGCGTGVTHTLGQQCRTAWWEAHGQRVDRQQAGAVGRAVSPRRALGQLGHAAQIFTQDAQPSSSAPHPLLGHSASHLLPARMVIKPKPGPGRRSQARCAAGQFCSGGG